MFHLMIIFFEIFHLVNFVRNLETFMKPCTLLTLKEMMNTMMISSRLP